MQLTHILRAVPRVFVMFATLSGLMLLSSFEIIFPGYNRVDTGTGTTELVLNTQSTRSNPKFQKCYIRSRLKITMAQYICNQGISTPVQYHRNLTKNT